MCVVLVYFLTLRMSIFENFMLDDKLVTKHYVIKAEHAQTVQSDTVGYYHRSKLCCFRGYYHLLLFILK